jgi:hypothetical protein
MSMYTSTYDDIIYGPDGESPFRPGLERAFKQALDDEQRIRIEIRTRPEGVPGTRQEHSFTIEPDPQHIDAVMRVVAERLNDSPGEHFTGELRINYFAAGSSTIRYGSFTRTIRPHRALRSHMPNHNAGNPGLEGLLGEPESENGDNSLGDLDKGGIPPHIMALLQQSSSAGSYDPQLLQLLETSWGFLFRSQAQQMAMFERTISMVETFSLRFGMPHPHERGLIDDKATGGGGGGGGDGGVMALLPALLNAAGHMAGSTGTADAVQRAGSLAAGAPPPSGAARQMAIEGAGRLMRNLPRGWASEPEAAEPVDDYPEEASPYNDSGSNETFGQNNNFALDSYRPREENNAMPDVDSMNSDQVLQTLRDWVSADPENRKKEIRNRMGELSDLIM